MKRIMVLGAGGMAGHTIVNYLKSLSKYDIFTIGRNDNLVYNDAWINDIEIGLEDLNFIIRCQKPDIIINAVGMLVKPCSDNPGKAIFINSYLPHWLSRQEAKIIHLSTDCIFSGKRGQYKDTDTPDGEGVYAKTKILGEIVNDKDLTIRMSIIGKELKKEGSGLFEWALRQKGTITGWDRAYWTGITIYELAKAIDKLIESDIIGLYQLSMPHKISKYELLKLIVKVWNKNDIKIEKNISEIHDKSLINSSVAIPNYKMPMSYKIMLEEYKAYLKGAK